MLSTLIYTAKPCNESEIPNSIKTVDNWLPTMPPYCNGAKSVRFALDQIF